MTGRERVDDAVRRIPRPLPGEYPPYAQMYLDLLPDDDRLLQHLRDGLQAAVDLVSGLAEEQLLHRYAPDRWTIKEVLVHVVDDERIYTCRAMCFARGEATPLPGFEQDDGRTPRHHRPLRRARRRRAQSHGGGERQPRERPRPRLAHRRARAAPPQAAAGTVPVLTRAGSPQIKKGEARCLALRRPSSTRP
jgi:hypothetical protein